MNRILYRKNRKEFDANHHQNPVKYYSYMASLFLLLTILYDFSSPKFIDDVYLNKTF